MGCMLGGAGGGRRGLLSGLGLVAAWAPLRLAMHSTQRSCPVLQGAGPIGAGPWPDDCSTRLARPSAARPGATRRWSWATGSGGSTASPSAGGNRAARGAAKHGGGAGLWRTSARTAQARCAGVLGAGGKVRRPRWAPVASASRGDLRRRQGASPQVVSGQAAAFLDSCPRPSSIVCYRRVPLPMFFLSIIWGRNGSENRYFWLKTDRLKAKKGPNRPKTG
jgi:hypothetical protein